MAYNPDWGYVQSDSLVGETITPCQLFNTNHCKPNHCVQKQVLKAPIWLILVLSYTDRLIPSHPCIPMPPPHKLHCKAWPWAVWVEKDVSMAHMATGPSCLWILLIALGGCAKTQAAIRHAAQCVTGLRLMRVRLRWGFYCSPGFSIRSRWISYVFVRRQEGTTAVPFPNQILCRSSWKRFAPMLKHYPLVWSSS